LSIMSWNPVSGPRAPRKHFPGADGCADVVGELGEPPAKPLREDTLRLLPTAEVEIRLPRHANVLRGVAWPPPPLMVGDWDRIARETQGRPC
jgi:hypothetical protein